MEFEYDLEKSHSNKLKHGVDFEEIQALWSDDSYIEVPARTQDEPRYLVVGKYQGKIWSCVITYRGPSIRIISARRARPEEEELYERR